MSVSREPAAHRRPTAAVGAVTLVFAVVAGLAVSFALASSAGELRVLDVVAAPFAAALIATLLTRTAGGAWSRSVRAGGVAFAVTTAVVLVLTVLVLIAVGWALSKLAG